MKCKRFRFLPAIISLTRLIALPFLVLALNYGLVFVADALFLFAVVTDFADGYADKKFHLNSKFGAHFDATADFLFLFCCVRVFHLLRSLCCLDSIFGRV